MKRYLIVIVILVGAIIANETLSRSENPASRTALEFFPNTLGEWQSIDEQTIDERSMNVLLVDDYIMRSYINKNNHKIINLYIGYFKSQREGKQIHSPRQCLPGAGFSLEGKEIIEIVMDNENTEKVPVNLFIMRKGNERQVFLWWYQGRGRIYASEYMNKCYQVIDAMKHRRTDGALVRVGMAVEGDVHTSQEILTEFVKYISPFLHLYIPD